MFWLRILRPSFSSPNTVTVNTHHLTMTTRVVHVFSDLVEIIKSLYNCKNLWKLLKNWVSHDFNEIWYQKFIFLSTFYHIIWPNVRVWCLLRFYRILLRYANPITIGYKCFEMPNSQWSMINIFRHKSERFLYPSLDWGIVGSLAVSLRGKLVSS